MALLRFRKDRQAQDEKTRHLVQRIDQMEQILTDLKDHVQFLTIGPDQKSIYPSIIQEIKTSERQLYFDHVNDVRGHDIIKNSKEIIADASLQGVRVHFRCNCLTHGTNQQGHGYYATSFPEKLYYFQRRDAYRIPLWQSLISFRGLGPQGQLLEGNLYDLSLGGLGLHTRLSTSLLQGQDITKGEFELPDATIFMCDLKIGHVRHDRQSGYSQIGCRFIDMSKQESQRLARKIAHLEREQLQRRSRKG